MKTSKAKANTHKTENELSIKLNDLLANYQIFYQNLRGLHWNIKGPKFFELHAKFEEFYNNALLKIDEIAERILSLGSNPLHTFSDYLHYAEIKEALQINDTYKSIEVIIKNLEILLRKERELLHLSDKLNDEGTNSLISDYIKEQEKTLWMLRAYIS
ncbi:MAG: Dps family protein [Bacteroidia bacterium]